MRVLVTGAAGQVGQQIVAHARGADHQVIAADRQALDITCATAVGQRIDAESPDIVVNAAAYTQVDKAESDQEVAFSVNAHGARILAESCARSGLPLIHLSTDYVFDGASSHSYREDDPAAPINVYGQSKWEGEQAVRQVLAHHIVLRVGGVFSATSENFVTKVLRRAGDSQSMSMISDQHVGPTSAVDIADIIWQVIERIGHGRPIPWGTYHFGGVPSTSWYHFAECILDLARPHGSVATRQIIEIQSADYNSPARRPANSHLNSDKLQSALGIPPPRWQESLGTVVRLLHTKP